MCCSASVFHNSESQTITMAATEDSFILATERKFVRDTRAAQPKKKPCASKSSDSIYFNQFDLLENAAKDYTGPSSDYTVWELIEKDGGKAEQAVCDWVKSVVGDSTLEFCCRKALKLASLLDPQNVSNLKIPDVSIRSDDEITLLQIEVESEKNWETTCRKLVYGLVHQLTYQRNCDSQVMCVSGFYFPNTKRECVVQVDVTWMDEPQRFVYRYHNLDREDVKTRIRAALQRENVKSRTLTTKFILPLTSTYIEENFGSGAEQMPSGYSVLVVNRHTNQVFKLPLSPWEQKVLYRLERKRLTLSQSELPRDIKVIGDCEYIEFELLRPPLSLEEAKANIKGFVRSVVSAVEELHANNIAHLDIRLDNICLKEEGGRMVAVLIDFDRSGSCQARGKFERYGDSVMYEAKKDWTAGNVDWRQVGIMILRILHTEPNDYHSKIPEYSDPFICDLIDKGVFNSAEFENWCQNPTT